MGKKWENKLKIIEIDFVTVSGYIRINIRILGSHTENCYIYAWKYVTLLKELWIVMNFLNFSGVF